MGQFSLLDVLVARQRPKAGNTVQVWTTSPELAGAFVGSGRRGALSPSRRIPKLEAFDHWINRCMSGQLLPRVDQKSRR